LVGAQSMNRISRLERFYEIISQLERRVGGGFTLGTLSEQANLPERGVYFFFEDGEHRAGSTTAARVVRVGTHALRHGGKSTIKQRLGQHRGSASGNGNHRGSIFRLLVGQSWIARNKHIDCPSWGLKGEAKKAATVLGITSEEMRASEKPVEQAVSRYLAAMRVVVLPVLDAPGSGSDRGLIERNSIALLSNYNRPPLDEPSSTWMGWRSNRKLVRGSGLWNQRHVDEQDAPEFLGVFEELVHLT
jgi:hypothetical protein